MSFIEKFYILNKIKTARSLKTYLILLTVGNFLLLGLFFYTFYSYTLENYYLFYLFTLFLIIYSLLLTPQLFRVRKSVLVNDKEKKKYFKLGFLNMALCFVALGMSLYFMIGHDRYFYEIRTADQRFLVGKNKGEIKLPTELRFSDQCFLYKVNLDRRILKDNSKDSLEFMFTNNGQMYLADQEIGLQKTARNNLMTNYFGSHDGQKILGKAQWVVSRNENFKIIEPTQLGSNVIFAQREMFQKITFGLNQLVKSYSGIITIKVFGPACNFLQEEKIDVKFDSDMSSVDLIQIASNNTKFSKDAIYTFSIQVELSGVKSSNNTLTLPIKFID